MSRKATQEALERLHEALAKEMRSILEDGVTVPDKDTGEPTKLTPGAPYLNVIRQFLKDNGIEAVKGEGAADFNQFVGTALPFMGEDATH